MAIAVRTYVPSNPVEAPTSPAFPVINPDLRGRFDNTSKRGMSNRSISPPRLELYSLTRGTNSSKTKGLRVAFQWRDNIEPDAQL